MDCGKRFVCGLVSCTDERCSSLIVANQQDAYNSGKLGNLREFVNSGKPSEFKIYSDNFLMRPDSFKISALHDSFSYLLCR